MLITGPELTRNMGWQRRVVICAAVTADGKLDGSEAVILKRLLGEIETGETAARAIVAAGGTLEQISKERASAVRHPWAKHFDQASVVIVDEEVAETLARSQIEVRPLRSLALKRTLNAEMQNLRMRYMAMALTQVAVPPLVVAASVQTVAVELATLRLAAGGSSVWCFSGGELFRALFEREAVREVLLAVQPRVDGHRAAPSLSGPGGAGFFPASVACRLVKVETGAAGEGLLHYRVVKGRKREAVETAGGGGPPSPG